MFVMDKVAQRLFDLEIITDYDDIEKLRLAALMHDLGHFPFSHCLEIPIEKDPNSKGGSHEQLSAHLINNTSIKDKLDTFKPDEISSLITKGTWKNLFTAYLFHQI
jgi:HD superfamily phosphohydrolase